MKITFLKQLETSDAQLILFPEVTDENVCAVDGSILPQVVMQ
ncbi:hypothetical protein AmDm5_0957 [Acetobacter malorum]|nr:hypothetical protein AmDm5_0957 [Acetobacter malorum]